MTMLIRFYKYGIGITFDTLAESVYAERTDVTLKKHGYVNYGSSCIKQLRDVMFSFLIELLMMNFCLPLDVNIYSSSVGNSLYSKFQ